MARNKTPMVVRRCGHESPVLAEQVEGGKMIARCLACGQSGPVVRGGAEEALHALRDEALGRGPRSA